MSCNWVRVYAEEGMLMTRGTNLMQKFCFIIINISTCFGHLYAHLQEYRFVYYCIWCSALGVVAEVLRSRCVVLCTVCKFVSDCRDIYDNKTKLLHQVGTSRHFHTWCTVTHTSRNAKSERVEMNYEEMQVQNVGRHWVIYVSKNGGAV